MHTVPSFRLYYFAAFLLGAVIALLVAAPARAGEPANDREHGRPAALAPQSPDAYS